MIEKLRANGFYTIKNYEHRRQQQTGYTAAKTLELSSKNSNVLYIYNIPREYIPLLEGRLNYIRCISLV